MPQILDISLSIDRKTVTWPGLKGVSIEPAERMSNGDPVNVTDIAFCAHTGTHVDAPFHHFVDGRGVEGIPLDGLVGPALVADLTSVPLGIDGDDLTAAVPQDSPAIVLLKTRNSTEKNVAERWDDCFIYLEPDGAEWLRDRGCRGVGIDCLGIERYGRADGATHRILLGAGIALIEGLDLRAVSPGLYWFACLPVKISGIDGAPARAILVPDPTGALMATWSQLSAER